MSDKAFNDLYEDVKKLRKQTGKMAWAFKQMAAMAETSGEKKMSLDALAAYEGSKNAEETQKSN